MSTNWSISRKIYYRPKHDDYYWYDKLPPIIKKAMMESVNDWDSKNIHVNWKKHGVWATLELLKKGDISFIKKDYELKRVKSSYIEVDVKPLYSNW